MKLLLRFFALARMIVRRLQDDHCLRTAGSLTYTTLLSLVPLITVVLIWLAAFPFFYPFASAIQAFVFNNLMPDSVDAMEQYAGHFVENAAHLTTVGLVFLAATALMMLLTIDAAFNEIWRVRVPRPLLRRLVIYGAVIILGPLLIGVSLTLTSWLLSASAGWTQAIPYADAVLLKLTAMALTCAALTLLYRAMPNCPVRAGDALAGGVLAGVAFELAKQGFGIYITHFPTYTMVYGAFAAVPVFLLWMYVSWVVVLAGAVVVATLPDWRGQTASGAPRGDE